MTFEEWKEEYIAQFSDWRDRMDLENEKTRWRTAQLAWNTATAAERERCVEQLKELCYVGLGTGRLYLRLGEYVTVIEGDINRDPHFPNGPWDGEALKEVRDGFIAAFAQSIREGGDNGV